MKISLDKQIIPLVVLTGLFAWMFTEHLILYPDYPVWALSTQQISAGVALAINFSIYFAARKYYKYVLLTTLIIGLFNVLSFTSSSYRTGMNTSVTLGISKSVHSTSTDISLQVIPFLIGLLTYFLNFKKMNTYLIHLIKPTEEERKRKDQEYHQERIEGFMAKYNRLTDAELEAIIEENRYVPDAIEAAKQVLSRRQQ